MKKYIVLLTALFVATTLFAGNGSGTLFVVMGSNGPALQTSKLEGAVKFTTAHKENGSWVLGKVQIESNLLTPEVKNALIQSMIEKNWAPVEGQ